MDSQAAGVRAGLGPPIRHGLPHIRHFTASGVVFSGDHVLLVEHRKLGCWLYPGGHIDANEDPAQTVLREVYEETGIRCEIIATPGFTHPAANVIPSPWAICVQDVQDVKIGPHQHIDMVYVLRPVVAGNGNGQRPSADPQLAEVARCSWVPLTKLPSMGTPPELPELINAAAAYAAASAA